MSEAAATSRATAARHRPVRSGSAPASGRYGNEKIAIGLWRQCFWRMPWPIRADADNANARGEDAVMVITVSLP